MVPTFVFTVKEPRECLTAELFIMEDPSKSKCWKETQQTEKVKNNIAKLSGSDKVADGIQCR